MKPTFRGIHHFIAFKRAWIYHCSPEVDDTYLRMKRHFKKTADIQKNALQTKQTYFRKFRFAESPH